MQHLPIKNKLEYAYQAPPSVSLYPILGSLIRALGKKWRVLVVAPNQYQVLFEKLNKHLRSTEDLVITSAEKYDALRQSSTQPFDLVLSLYDDHSIKSDLSHVMVIDQKPAFDEYDLISEFKVSQLHETGVTAITGNGKGKTTTALGIAAEMFLNTVSKNPTKKVAVIQWFKEKKSGTLTWAINEHSFPDLLKHPASFQFYPTGAGFVGSPTMDRVAEIKEHRHRAQTGLELAHKMITSGEYGCVVLDELVDTLPQVMVYLPKPLLEVEDVQKILDTARSHDLKTIVTGRQVTPEWSDYIQDSIVISEIKHPWSFQKRGAISGLDF